MRLGNRCQDYSILPVWLKPQHLSILVNISLFNQQFACSFDYLSSRSFNKWITDRSRLQVCFNIWGIQILICMYIMTKKQNVHFLKDLKAIVIFYIWTVLLIVLINASYLAKGFFCLFFFSWTNSTLGKSTLALLLKLLHKKKKRCSKKSEILGLWIIWAKVHSVLHLKV